MPASALGEKEDLPIRQKTTVSKETPRGAEQTRTLGDLMMAVNSYAFIACLCGMKIKVPKGFKKKVIYCPKCRREHRVPDTQLAKAAAAAVAAGSVKDSKTGKEQSGPRVYKRSGTGWESLNCECGRLIQISPAFEGQDIKCCNCNRQIRIIK
jgi:hypothetical protein